MPLTLLTPELKLRITDHLDPVSTLNFALTCKEHWTLSQNLLEHHTRRFAEELLLASYKVEGAPRPRIDGPPRTRIGIWQTLEDVLRDPKDGWYITEIDLRSCWVSQNRKAPEDVPPVFLEAAMELMDLYPPLADGDWRVTKTSVRVYEVEDPAEKCIVTQIYNDVKSGSPAGVLAILIHHLPNLRTIRMTMDNDDATFSLMIDWVAIEYMDAAKVPCLPFQRLKTAALSHYDTEGCIAADWALTFLRFPSLRTFAASMMGGDFRRKMDISKAASFQPASGVEEFIFSSCQFEAKAVEYMIARTRSLKRFSYSAGGACTDEALYDPKVVLNALSKYAQDSLEHLLLEHFDLSEEERLFRDAPRWDQDDGCDSDDDSSGLEDESRPSRPIRVKLTGLKKLRAMHANWAMLWPEVYHDVPVLGGNYEYSRNLDLYRHPFDIRTVLPPSLEWLILHGGFQESEWANLVEPLATPSEHTPLLDMDRIRIAGRVHSERKERQTGVTAVGGWPLGEKRVFGNAENAWFKGIAPRFNLFAGHGW